MCLSKLSLSALIAYFIIQTEPKILHLVWILMNNVLLVQTVWSVDQVIICSKWIPNQTLMGHKHLD